MLRSVVLVAGLMSSGLSVFALDGPVPLAWRWKGETTFPPTAQPTIAGDMVVVPVGRRVYALDAEMGFVRWMFPATEAPSGEFRVEVPLSGEVLIASNSNRMVFGIDRSTGRTLWSVQLAAAVVRRAVTNDSEVFLFLSDNRVTALRTSDGTRTWSQDYDLKDNVVGQPILYEGNLIFFVSRGELVALNTATRRPAWTAKVLSLSPDTTPVIYDRSVFVTTGRQVVRLNPTTGAVQAVIDFPEYLAGAPALTPKGGAVASQSGNVYIFDLVRRRVRPKPIELKGYLVGYPQPAGSNILVRTRNGGIYLIDPSREVNPVLWEYLTLPIPGTMRSTTAGPAGGEGGGGGAGISPGPGAGAQAGAVVPADYVTVYGQLALNNGRVYALAEDGSVFAFGTSWSADEVGPRISLLYPPMGAAMSGQPDLDIIFRIEDAGTGVMSRSLRVTMNGQDMNFEYVPGGGYVYVRIRPPGSKTPGANLPLTDGKKTIVVSAADWAGNISEKTFTLTIDNTLPVIRERVIDERTGGPSTGGRGGGPGTIG